MPARDDFDVFELRPWLGYLHIVHVVDGGRDFLHIVYGTELAIVFGIDLTGKTLSAIPAGARESVRRAYAAVCATGEPLFIEDDPVLQSSVERVEELVLPLSSDGVVVDRLLIGAARVKRLEDTDLALLERRRASRVAVLLGGMMQVGADWESCTVLDYSSLGARLQLERDPAPAGPLAVAFAAFAPVRARVVWQSGRRAGIEFTERLMPRLVG